jgi:hypothetical protein
MLSCSYNPETRKLTSGSCHYQLCLSSHRKLFDWTGEYRTELLMPQLESWKLHPGHKQKKLCAITPLFKFSWENLICIQNSGFKEA